MGDFSAEDLLEAAKKRFRENVLQAYILGAAGDPGAADLELKKIARSVISRAQAALAPSIGWPLPGVWPAGSTDIAGTDISGRPYREVWPENLLENALSLFLWRGQSGLASVSENQRRVGKMAEDFFDRIQEGGIGLGIQVSTDVSAAEPIAARDRSGRTLIGTSADRTNLLETMAGPGWDWQ